MVHGSLSVLPGDSDFKGCGEREFSYRDKEGADREEENPESIRVTEARRIQLLQTRRNQVKSNKIRTDMTTGSVKFTGDPLSHW